MFSVIFPQGLVQEPSVLLFDAPTSVSDRIWFMDEDRILEEASAEAFFSVFLCPRAKKFLADIFPHAVC